MKLSVSYFQIKSDYGSIIETSQPNASKCSSTCGTATCTKNTVLPTDEFIGGSMHLACLPLD